MAALYLSDVFKENVATKQRFRYDNRSGENIVKPILNT